MLKLYHNDMSTCSQKVRFLLAEKGAEWEGEVLDLRRGDQLQPEFLKFNPKGLVPVLIHDGHIVTESNIIIEYLNEVYPDPPLLPADPASRAKARWWMKKLDDGIHLEVAVLSFAIAFRHQLIKACGSDESIGKAFCRYPRPVYPGGTAPGGAGRDGSAALCTSRPAIREVAVRYE